MSKKNKLMKFKLNQVAKLISLKRNEHNNAVVVSPLPKAGRGYTKPFIYIDELPFIKLSRKAHACNLIIMYGSISNISKHLLNCPPCEMHLIKE